VTFLIDVIFFFTFALTQETVLVYASKFARENPQVLDNIVAEAHENDKLWIQSIMSMMKEKVYPFGEIT
jgi:hypothetical protein